MTLNYSFNGIPEFVAVAETQGFTSAANKLNVSTSHISRQIAKLEQRLGVALFARSTRKVKLTDAGERYYQHCLILVDSITTANEEVGSQQVELSGTLRVSAAGEFAEQYIVPKLIEFAQLHPSLKLDIDFNSNMVDFVQEGVDFSIRYGQLKDSSLIARKLVDRHLVAAASQTYLNKNGTPTHPSDLKEHNCVIANTDLWRFEENNKPLTVKVNARWRSNSGRSLVKASEADLGVCYMPRSSFADSIESGRLVEILQPYWSSHITTWIVYANRQYLPTRARMAIDFLIESFKDFEE